MAAAKGLIPQVGVAIHTRIKLVFSANYDFIVDVD